MARLPWIPLLDKASNNNNIEHHRLALESRSAPRLEIL